MHVSTETVLPNEAKINDLIRKMAIDMLSNKMAPNNGSAPGGVDPRMADELAKLLDAPTAPPATTAQSAVPGLCPLTLCCDSYGNMKIGSRISVV